MYIKTNTTSATSGAGTAYISSETSLTSGFKGHVAHFLVFCVD